MKKFWGAVADALANDAMLVSLTGHDASGNDRRFFQSRQQVPIKKPSVSFDGEIRPGVEKANTTIRLTVVTFHVWGNADEQLTVEDIQGRLIDLLQGSDTPTNVVFWDVTNSDIRCLSATFTNSSRVNFDEETDSWFCTVSAEFLWYEIEE